MERWKESIHEFIVIAWLPKYQSWSISWHSGARHMSEREYNVKIAEAILKIEDWVKWRSEKLDDCWLPNSWSLALLDCWAEASEFSGVESAHSDYESAVSDVQDNCN